MNDPYPEPTTSNSCMTPNEPRVEHTEPKASPGLTRTQRLLAAAVTAAVLASGINALVQVARVLVQGWLTS